MEINGVALVFGIAGLMSGSLMTFFPNIMYDWQAKMFFKQSTHALMMRIFGPITILVGILLIVGSFAKLL